MKLKNTKGGDKKRQSQLVERIMATKLLNKRGDGYLTDKDEGPRLRLSSWNNRQRKEAYHGNA